VVVGNPGGKKVSPLSLISDQRNVGGSIERWKKPTKNTRGGGGEKQGARIRGKGRGRGNPA